MLPRQARFSLPVKILQGTSPVPIPISPRSIPSSGWGAVCPGLQPHASTTQDAGNTNSAGGQTLPSALGEGTLYVSNIYGWVNAVPLEQISRPWAKH